MKNKPKAFSETEKEYTDAVLEGLDVKNKAVTGRSFYGCLFRNCDFTGGTFNSCRFNDCRFESCNLSLAVVRGSVFSNTSFKDSKLAGVNWTEAAWPALKLPAALEFTSCVLKDARFSMPEAMALLYCLDIKII